MARQPTHIGTNYAAATEECEEACSAALLGCGEGASCRAAAAEATLTATGPRWLRPAAAAALMIVAVVSVAAAALGARSTGLKHLQWRHQAETLELLSNRMLPSLSTPQAAKPKPLKETDGIGLAEGAIVAFAALHLAFVGGAVVAVCRFGISGRKVALFFGLDLLVTLLVAAALLGSAVSPAAKPAWLPLGEPKVAILHASVPRPVGDMHHYGTLMHVPLCPSDEADHNRPLWRSFGPDTSCGADSSRSSNSSHRISVSSLGACQAMCRAQVACAGIEYSHRERGCELRTELAVGGEVAPAKPGSECFSFWRYAGCGRLIFHSVLSEFREHHDFVSAKKRMHAREATVALKHKHEAGRRQQEAQRQMRKEQHAEQTIEQAHAKQAELRDQAQPVESTIIEARSREKQTNAEKAKQQKSLLDVQEDLHKAQTWMKEHESQLDILSKILDATMIADVIGLVATLGTAAPEEAAATSGEVASKVALEAGMKKMGEEIVAKEAGEAIAKESLEAATEGALAASAARTAAQKELRPFIAEAAAVGEEIEDATLVKEAAEAATKRAQLRIAAEFGAMQLAQAAAAEAEAEVQKSKALRGMAAGEQDKGLKTGAAENTLFAGGVAGVHSYFQKQGYDLVENSTDLRRAFKDLSSYHQLEDAFRGRQLLRQGAEVLLHTEKEESDRLVAAVAKEAVGGIAKGRHVEVKAGELSASGVSLERRAQADTGSLVEIGSGFLSAARRGPGGLSRWRHRLGAPGAPGSCTAALIWNAEPTARSCADSASDGAWAHASQAVLLEVNEKGEHIATVGHLHQCDLPADVLRQAQAGDIGLEPNIGKSVMSRLQGGRSAAAAEKAGAGILCLKGAFRQHSADT